MSGDLVLLTGGTGMIGFRTLVLLLEKGYAVRAAVRNQSGFDRIASLAPVAKFRQQLTSVIVPDITAPGAYDEAVQGVKYVMHVASPLAGKNAGSDYEKLLIQPAVQGTVGMLESAAKATGIQRVVITASVASISSSVLRGGGDIITEQTNDVLTTGPFPNEFAAYGASKALAYQASKRFVADNKPSFDVVNIMPSFVLGRDDTVTEASDIAKGTNGLLMGPILGHARDTPLTGTTVHIDDVAKMHVLSLDSGIVPDSQDFLAAGPDYGSIDWADSFEIIKRRFPKQYAAGVFKFDSIPRPVTAPVRSSNAKAAKTFGIEFKGFEEQVVSVTEHFLELIGQQ